ncbi:MAG: DUF2232 domain-containing protein [bacterium]|nr:DUF2232 domain-containing protein [bacterium]
MEVEAPAVRPLRGQVFTYLFNLALSVMLFQSVIFSLFTPLPQMFCYLRLGRWAGLSIPLIVFALFSLAGTGAGFSYLLQFALPGVLLSETIRRGYSIERAFFISVATVLVFSLGSLAFVASGKGLSSRDMVAGFVEKVLEETIAYNEKALGSKEQVREFKKAAPIVVEMVSSLYYSLAAIALMFTLWLNVVGLSRLARSSGLVPPFGGSLSKWKAPEHLVWGAVAGGVALLSGHELAGRLGINLLLILFVIYFFQGMAIISYMLKKREVSVFLKGAAYILAVWYFSIIIALVGLFDLWVDFRKLSPAKEESR